MLRDGVQQAKWYNNTPWDNNNNNNNNGASTTECTWIYEKGSALLLVL
jgi:hypothetical protein